MSVTSFGAPIEPEDQQSQQKVNGTATPSDAPQDLLDPNDPRLVSEELNVNPEADAYAQPAPPQDGDYRAKLKLMQSKGKSGGTVLIGGQIVKLTQDQDVDATTAIWGGKKRKEDEQAVYVMGLEASIIDPSGKYDGLKAFDFQVSTFLQMRNGEITMKVSSILSKLRRPDGKLWVDKNTKGNAKFWAELFIKALAGEPECGITTAWEWSCADCGKDAKQRGVAYPKSVVGMHKFPPEADPKKRAAGQLFSPEMKCQVVLAHGYSRARITIAKFLSLEELKK